jgi:hypothetical protein
MLVAEAYSLSIAVVAANFKNHRLLAISTLLNAISMLVAEAYSLSIAVVAANSQLNLLLTKA